jgi:hypothetical protein
MIEMPIWMLVTWIIFTFLFGLEVGFEWGKKKGIKFMADIRKYIDEESAKTKKWKKKLRKY